MQDICVADLLLHTLILSNRTFGIKIHRTHDHALKFKPIELFVLIGV